MKSIKLYEGFIEDMKNEFQRVLNERKKKFDPCLQQMFDEYNLEYASTDDSLTDIILKSYIVYTTYDEFELSESLINDIIQTTKRLRQFEDIDIEFSIKIKPTKSKFKLSRNILFSTDPWFKNSNKNQKQYVENINDIKLLFDEQTRDILLNRDGRVMTKEPVDYSLFTVTQIELMIR